MQITPLLCLLLSTCPFILLLAQVQNKGRYRLVVARPSKAGSIRQTRVYDLPELDNEQLEMQAETEESFISYDEPPDEILKPYKFAENIPMPIDLSKEGVWEINEEGGFRVLRATITSRQATSLSLIFKDFYLPEHGELYIIGQDRILGAFVGQINNKPEGKFATLPLPGEALLIEYYEPLPADQCHPYEKLARKGVRPSTSLQKHPVRPALHRPTDTPRLSLQAVSHGFRPYMKNFGDSGNCNVDVACEKRAGVCSTRVVVSKLFLEASS